MTAHDISSIICPIGMGIDVVAHSVAYLIVDAMYMCEYLCHSYMHEIV